MDTTKLLYLEDFSLTEYETVISEILEEEGKKFIVLDQTCFYPQGGGQPYDQGIIESSNGKFIVSEVRFIDGVVRCIGSLESGNLNKGDQIKCSVDKSRRELNSKLHSAGHVVDMAVNELGLNWIPGKGFHFPEGPYVEYAGSLEGQDTEKLKRDIEDLCNKFISESIETSMRFMDKDEMKTVCHFVPDYIPKGKPARVVLFGDFGVPCGGTHVNNLSEIGKMTIRKVKQNGESIRVGYDVSR